MTDDLRDPTLGAGSRASTQAGAGEQRAQEATEEQRLVQAEAESLAEAERIHPDHYEPGTGAPGAGGATVAAGGAVTGAEGGLWRDAWEELRRSKLFLLGAVIVVILIAMAIAPQLFTRGVSPRNCGLERSLGRPSWPDAPFGYDVQGCDYYANVIYGVRPSIIIGIVCTIATFIIALIFGSISGFYGGKIDTIISRITDVFFAIPYLLFGIIILTVIETKGVATVALVLIITSWTTMLRLMRSSVISVRDADYVQAARALGASDFRLLTKHILPNSLAATLAYATLVVGVFIVGEATLSFLGIGLQLPDISWGLQLSSAQQRFVQARHLLIFPGLFLSLTVFAFTLIGNAVRDALDPKLR